MAYSRVVACQIGVPNVAASKQHEPTNVPAKTESKQTVPHLDSVAHPLRWPFRHVARRLMKRDAAFPRPVHIGRYRYWHLDAIEAYERSVAAKRCSSVTYPSAALRD